MTSALDDGRAELIREIRDTADKLERDGASRGDLKILARAFKELRYAFKVFSEYRGRKKITVFGSARTKPDHPDFLASIDFGRKMAAKQWMVLTGAGNGIMEGAHVGAGREMSMGVNIMLPFEQSANSIIAGDPKLVHFKYFFTRKLMFVKEVHAVACFPGGYGTLDEFFEVVTLVQTGKRDLFPIVCIDQPGCDYWAKLKNYLHNELGGRGLISPDDLALIKFTHTVDDAVDEVMRFYRIYHSMRYVRDHLVLRLQEAPTEEQIEFINTKFGGLLTSGRIELVPEHAHEADDLEAHGLPRLGLHFNRRDIGGLRLLVDWLNHNVERPVS